MQCARTIGGVRPGIDRVVGRRESRGTGGRHIPARKRAVRAGAKPPLSAPTVVKHQHEAGRASAPAPPTNDGGGLSGRTAYSATHMADSMGSGTDAVAGWLPLGGARVRSANWALSRERCSAMSISSAQLGNLPWTQIWSESCWPADCTGTKLPAGSPGHVWRPRCQ